MASFVTADLDPTDRYKLLTGLVVPRPIGWIGTASTDGVANVAPYSFFQAVAAHPPTVLFSAGVTGGHQKDSLRNAKASGEFTCNLVDMTTSEAMNQTAAELDPTSSEFDFAGLTPAPSTLISAPRVAEARASFECRVTQVIELGTAPNENHVVFGEVVVIHADDEILDGTRVDFGALDAVGRLAGNGYASTRDRFSLTRPGN